MRTNIAMGLIGLAVVLLAPGSVARQAEAAMLCRKKSGKLFVRDTDCRRRETAVDPASIGVVGPAGGAGATAPDATGENALYVGADQDADEPGSTLTLGTDGTPLMAVLENGNVGVGTTTPATTLAVAGTCSQPLDDQGFVKAWARIDPSGSIAACYNCNSSPTETQRLDVGQYEVDFTPLGVDIRTRPRLVAMDVAGTPVTPGSASTGDRSGDPSSIFVLTVDPAGNLANRAFVLVVY